MNIRGIIRKIRRKYDDRELVIIRDRIDDEMMMIDYDHRRGKKGERRDNDDRERYSTCVNIIICVCISCVNDVYVCRISYIELLLFLLLYMGCDDVVILEIIISFSNYYYY